MIEYHFESLGDVAQQLVSYADDARRSAASDHISKRDESFALGQMAAFERAAHILRHTHLVEIGA